ncbi:dihydrofolate reductase family protein [Jiangella ureilytica]|uniref:dihydrofolate reductase family protein n=1 Tax=Jiangella ureilytica TaxID=2530374 RepID=UPI0013A5E56D|nr:dihydrofolate reductase family protein [Jiangella ureilytica]
MTARIGRTISASAFVSLDGVVNHMEKWHYDYVDDESDALALEQLRAAGALLMGRKTYEVYAATWPGRDGVYADAINAMPKLVASTTLGQPARANTEVLDGELVQSIRALRAEDGAPILMHGYGPVAKALLEAYLLELDRWQALARGKSIHRSSATTLRTGRPIGRSASSRWRRTPSRPGLTPWV